MKTVGVICEYNPFHSGHLAQIEYIKETFPGCKIVALMSGNFVQRGECAIVDKYDRAEVAVRCGANLVLELPYPYACAPAEVFATGAVRILDALGVDTLVFGSESGDIEKLTEAAKKLSSEEFANELALAKDRESDGSVSHIRMSEDVFSELYGEGFPVGANDILGVEYIKAASGSGMELHTYARKPGYTATGARRAILRGDNDALSNLVPDAMCRKLEDANIARFDNLSGAILSHFRLRDPGENACIADFSGGAEYLFADAARMSSSVSEMEDACSGKRTTRAKARRMMLFSMLGVTREMLGSAPTYTSVLAFDFAGRAVLREMRRESSIRILTRPADMIELPSARVGVRAELLYLCAKDRPENFADFVKRHPFSLE